VRYWPSHVAQHRCLALSSALLVAMLLTACSQDADRRAPAPRQAAAVAGPAGAVLGAKVGKLTQDPMLLKHSGPEAGGRAAAPAGRELTVIVGALQAVLATRPGTYVQTDGRVMDNETLAAQNENPEYGQLLARWGRQTGYYAAFDLDGETSDAGLLRASVLVSRYGSPAGTEAAYAYVVEQESQRAQRFDVTMRGEAQEPWDEAVVFYRETTGNGYTVGHFTLIFRSGTLIAFVTNIGLADAVSTRDTSDLTQAVVERLSALR
jgi:hypothetical protein